MINVAVLIDKVPNSVNYSPYIVEASERYQIDTWLRQMHFLSQLAYESAGFTQVRESLNYSASSLKILFGSHRITSLQANKYGRSDHQPANQQAIGNILYGGEFGRVQLGNTQPGDGYKFRGRGLIQTTGRANYLRASLGLFNNDILILEPQLLESPRWAALAAGLFWYQNSISPIADLDDLVGVTRRINGGTNGIESKGSPKWVGSRGWWLERLKLEL